MVCPKCNKEVNKDFFDIHTSKCRKDLKEKGVLELFTCKKCN